MPSAILAPLLWGSARSLALGMLALMALGALAFLAYLFLLRRTPAAAPAAVASDR